MHAEFGKENAVKSFSEFFDEITEKDKVVSFAKEFQKNRSAKAKKEAVLFLKKWGVK